MSMKFSHLTETFLITVQKLVDKTYNMEIVVRL